MKYALKPSSRYLDVNSSNKIIMFEDEKSLFDFFHIKMKQDLLNPVLKSERYNWKMRNKPNDISQSDVIGLYSFLVSSEVDFKFLSWSSRVAKFVHNNINTKENPWAYCKILYRMRSLPFNWTLYEFKNKDGGFVMHNIGWGAFFRKAEKENLLNGVNVSYRLPE